MMCGCNLEARSRFTCEVMRIMDSKGDGGLERWMIRPGEAFLVNQ